MQLSEVGSIIIPILQGRKLSDLAGPNHHPLARPQLAPGSSDLSSALPFLSDTANDHLTIASMILLISISPQRLPTSKQILPFSSCELTAIIHRDPGLTATLPFRYRV